MLDSLMLKYYQYFAGKVIIDKYKCVQVRLVMKWSVLSRKASV